MKLLVTLSGLTLYTPDNPAPAPAGAIFLKSEDDADWYQAQIHFAADTRKIGYDTEGLILIQNNDVSALWPIDMSVTEINETDLPAGFPVSGDAVVGWRYQDNQITRIPVDDVMVATRQRDSKMSAVSSRITALTEAQEDGDITPDEQTELAALREYRTALRRLDLSVAPDIDWPVAPSM